MYRFLICFVCAMPLCAVTIGQVDDFEDGTTQGWKVNSLGQGAPSLALLPANEITGGPAGATDNFLKLNSAGGSGSGSRLVVNNLFAQWSGDYAALGLTAIAMDLRNLGATDLAIRLMLENPDGGPPTDVAITDAVALPSGGGWTHVQFDLSPGSLTAVLGDVNALLANVTGLRIYHSASAEFPGAPVAATLGVDNITALGAQQPVPEPATIMFVAGGLAAVLMRRARMRPRRD
ncbi:MAG: PEP-CTERM sorting domain-containing protein [Bryobacterales bacterium]|nr:PEP-CTERM sorting domain-containing protein [Bryobacterales bacterium]